MNMPPLRAIVGLSAACGSAALVAFIVGGLGELWDHPLEGAF
jgi:hypothetical protein